MGFPKQSVFHTEDLLASIFPREHFCITGHHGSFGRWVYSVGNKRSWKSMALGSIPGYLPMTLGTVGRPLQSWFASIPCTLPVD